jgi:hypothetical protein
MHAYIYEDAHDVIFVVVVVVAAAVVVFVGAVVVVVVVAAAGQGRGATSLSEPTRRASTKSQHYIRGFVGWVSSLVQKSRCSS